MIGNWNDIPLFLALAEHGRIAPAAKALGLNHVTVLRRLNKLEDELGVRLFERHHDGYLLTEPGREMLPVAERTAIEIERLNVRLAGKDVRPSGTVRLTTTDTIANFVLVPLLPGFFAQYPEVDVSLIIAPQYRNLSRYEADLAIRVTNDPPEHLIGKRLLQPKWSLYASAAYLKSCETQPTRETLRDHPVITASDVLGQFSAMKCLRQLVGKDYEPRLETNSLQNIYMAVAQGLGIGILPDYVIQTTPQFQRLDIELGTVTSQVWMLLHPDLQHVQRIRVLMNYLAENIKKA